MPIITKRLHITGIVQGVGFRPTVFNLAQRFQLTGWVLNSAHGVEINLRGAEQNVQAFIQDLQQNPPPLAVIVSFTVEDAPDQTFVDFQILQSVDDLSDFLPVSPDLSICPDCRRELFDPSDRRYRYPFINCTNCGPRFSIVTGIPYDRPNTSMAGFSLCPDCAEEYHQPANRRFHAQPIACPVCGPQVWYEEGGHTLAKRESALQAARKALSEGKILAVKGLGGFHLVCDAQNPQTLEKLRLRKRRSGKPFALMAFNLETIKEYASVSPDEEKLLTSPMSPVVLLETTPLGKELAGLVAPDQNRLGFILPYTPLHLLLLEPVEGFPKVLVMSSGNLSEEPIAYANEDAQKRLSHLADGFLLHNRPIHTRIDDSVVSVIETLPHIQRRARGFAPLPLQIPIAAIPTLAFGTELKNTFCLVRDRYAFVSHHIGDLENQEPRGNLRFSSQVRSDIAPLNHKVKALLDANLDVHVLRDPTRGGLATSLVEIARQSQVNIQLDEESIPIDKPVRKTCELFGLDPLYLANEGKLILILPADQAEEALRVLHKTRYGEQAAMVGHVPEPSKGQVWLKTPYGTTRVLEMLAGEMLPRIC